VDILCSDKTGTLTRQVDAGRSIQRQRHPYRISHPDAALASRADDKDTIDLAVLGGLKDTSVQGYMYPFPAVRPVHKRTEATGKDADGNEFKSPGCATVILELSANAAQVKPPPRRPSMTSRARFRSLAWRGRGGRLAVSCVLPCSIRQETMPRQPSHRAADGVSVKMVTVTHWPSPWKPPRTRDG